jgi:predicted ArsR family transcriptional regulator
MLFLTSSSEASSALRMLEAMKRQAPVSTSALAQALQMTVEAARQQINKLVEQGLVQGATQSPTGAGRPRQLWTLTAAGQAYFPDAHAQLSVQLIASIRKLFGDQGLDQLIADREAESRERYAQACTAEALPQRLEQLAQQRSLEGYMARVEHRGGGWLLVEDHCPICAAASSCQGFCRSEQTLFQEVVGSAATVERGEYLLDGGQRCVYWIQPHPKAA